MYSKILIIFLLLLSMQGAAMQLAGKPATEPEKKIEIQIVIKPFILSINKDEYELGPQGARGTFGVIHFGTWQGSPVAIKKFHLKTLPSHLKSEFENHAKANHPYVISFYGLVDIPGKFSMIEELMPETLKEFESSALYSDKTNPAYEAFYNRDEATYLEMFASGAWGINYLHQVLKIAHKHIKSFNFGVFYDLRSKKFYLKTMDFGLSKLKLEASSNGGNEGDGATVRWRAPESFTREYMRVKDGIDAHYADAYSYGLLMAEKAIGEIPWANKSEPEVVQIKTHKKDDGWLKEKFGEKLEKKLYFSPQCKEAGECVSQAYMKLVGSCTLLIPKERPTMAAIANGLETLSKEFRQAKAQRKASFASVQQKMLEEKYEQEQEAAAGQASELMRAQLAQLPKPEYFQDDIDPSLFAIAAIEVAPLDVTVILFELYMIIDSNLIDDYDAVALSQTNKHFMKHFKKHKEQQEELGNAMPRFRGPRWIKAWSLKHSEDPSLAVVNDITDGNDRERIMIPAFSQIQYQENTPKEDIPYYDAMVVFYTMIDLRSAIALSQVSHLFNKTIKYGSHKAWDQSIWKTIAIGKEKWQEHFKHKFNEDDATYPPVGFDKFLAVQLCPYSSADPTPHLLDTHICVLIPAGVRAFDFLRTQQPSDDFLQGDEHCEMKYHSDRSIYESINYREICILMNKPNARAYFIIVPKKVLRARGEDKEGVGIKGSDIRNMDGQGHSNHKRQKYTYYKNETLGKIILYPTLLSALVADWASFHVSGEHIFSNDSHHNRATYVAEFYKNALQDGTKLSLRVLVGFPEVEEKMIDGKMVKSVRLKVKLTDQSNNFGVGCLSVWQPGLEKTAKEAEPMGEDPRD